MSSVAERLASLSEADRRAVLSQLSEAEAASLIYDWRGFHARPDQIEPDGDWDIWLCLAGRGWGKTRTGAEWVREHVERGTASRIALVAETSADARDVMVAELLRIFPKDRRPNYIKSSRRVDFHNGAKAWTYNATEPDQLRGPQHDLAWCDELAKWRYARETWDMLQFGLRLGEHPRQIVTTTPRPIELVKAIIAGSEGRVAVTRGRTLDNRANLAPAFIERIEKRYGGTRLGRQELNAEILSDLPGALWSQQSIDGYRVPPPKVQRGKDWRDVMREEMDRIVVAVDPAITAGEESDEHGIIVAGLKDNVGHVLEDGSLTGTPVEWARRAVSLSTTWGADGVVVEVNQGGDMVKHTLHTVSPNLNVIEVRASRGKHVRAEPIAALYEQGRARHVGQFPELEAQMTQMTQQGYEGEGSPDRLDALVWALSDLFPDMVEVIPDASRVSPVKRALRSVNSWMGG